MTKKKFHIPDSENCFFSEMSDLKIWRKFKGGDDSAFVFIYRTYVNDLFQIGYQLSRDEDLIKDCIQDLFIEILNRRYSLGNTNNIRLYLIKSFRRKLIQCIKKNYKLVRQDQINESYFVELTYEESITKVQFDGEQLKRLNKALSKLKVKDREIIYYYFYENFSYSEIADILDYIHISSARRSIYKALNRLKQFITTIVIILLCLLSCSSENLFLIYLS